MKISIDKLYSFLFSLLLLLLINTPTVHKEIKISILLCLVAIILYKILLNKLHIQKDIALLSMISILFGSFFIFNGVIHSNPGAIPSITVILIWPFLYMLFIGANGYNNIFIAIDKVLLFSAYFIPIYGLYFLLGKTNIIPSTFFFNIFPKDVMGGVGLYEGSIEVSILNLASVLFIAPYIFTKFLLQDDFKEKFIYGIAIFLLIGIVLLSGRRALLLVTVGSLLLILIASFFIKLKKIGKDIRRKGIALILYTIMITFILIIIVRSYYEIDLYKIYDSIIEGLSFDSSSDPSTQARTMQFFSLINGWSQSPIFGNGFGAVASVTRNTDMPWAYELSYIALLFHVGLFGVIIYVSLVFWIVWQGLKISKNMEDIQYIFPYIVGLLSFLVGNASNPYLMKFDYLWVIFLPVMYINYYKLTKQGRK
jgi:hypothetical protein